MAYKKPRSVGDWPQRPSKVNDRAFDSMINVTESDTLFDPGTKNIRKVTHKGVDGEKVIERWFNWKDENFKTSERQMDADGDLSKQTVFDEEGKQTGIITYDKGQLRTVKEYYPDGSVKRDVKALGSDSLSKHHVHGSALNVNPINIIDAKEYYPDGSLKSRRQGNEEGQPRGLQEDYWPGGSLKKTRNYDANGRRHGKHISYNRDGSVRRTRVWEEGVLIEDSNLSKEEIEKRNVIYREGQ